MDVCEICEEVGERDCYHCDLGNPCIECAVHDCVNYGRYIGGNDGTSGKPQTFVTSFTSLEIVGRTKPCEE